jgi:hypothetical protein
VDTYVSKEEGDTIFRVEVTMKLKQNVHPNSVRTSKLVLFFEVAVLMPHPSSYKSVIILPHRALNTVHE